MYDGGQHVLDSNTWQLKYKEFFESCKMGKDVADARVERALYERAVGYNYDSEKLVVVDGEIHRVPVKEHVPPEFNSMRFWLANRQKKRWKDLARLELGVDEANPIAAW